MTTPAAPRTAQSVRDLLELRLGVPVSARDSTPTAQVTVGQVLKQDAARVFWMVINLGAFVVFIAPATGSGGPSATRGIRLEANGGTATAWWEEDGELTAWEWQSLAVGGASSLFVIEVVIDQGARPQ